MAYELRDNSGSAFNNDRKEKETHADFTGKSMVGGKVYYVSAWRKKRANGEGWLSFSYKPVDESAKPQRPAAQTMASDHARECKDSPFRSGGENVDFDGGGDSDA